MDQSCADNFHAAFEEFKADGGKVEGIVEWVSDADIAKQVRLQVFFSLFYSRSCVTHMHLKCRTSSSLLYHFFVPSSTYRIL